MTGYFIFGFGIVCIVNANLGLTPWDVFHQGLAQQLNITMGVATQITGAVIIIINLFMKIDIGWGTVGNVYFIGLFFDLIDQSKLIPIYQALVPRILMMFLGMFLVSLGTYLYLSAQVGSGPRDGLMVALTKNLKLPVGIIRSAIELSALAIGYLMGGFVGWGTIILSLGLGFFIQTTFSIFKFDVNKIEHRVIFEDIKQIIEIIKRKS